MWIQHPALLCSFKNPLSFLATSVNIFNEKKIDKTNQYSSLSNYFVLYCLIFTVFSMPWISDF